MTPLNTITLAGAFGHAHTTAQARDAATSRQQSSTQCAVRRPGVLRCLLAGLSRGSLRSA